jgi:GntR family transcriptional repressor for pyruvate dehydrogenase complex
VTTGSLKAVRKKKLFEEIVGQIKDLIDNGDLKAGDQLPPERELAEVFKVSRHSVREAIRTLEEQGILKSRRGSGTFVVLGESDNVVDYLARAVVREKDTLAEIFQFRQMVEPQIAALAALNASPENIRELKKIIKHQQSETSTKKQILLDNEFHMALAKAAGNSILYNIVERVGGILGQCRMEVYQSQRRSQISTKGHERILKALENKDSRGCEKAMAEHLKDIIRIVLTDNLKLS